MASYRIYGITNYDDAIHEPPNYDARYEVQDNYTLIAEGEGFLDTDFAVSGFNGYAILFDKGMAINELAFDSPTGPKYNSGMLVTGNVYWAPDSNYWLEPIVAGRDYEYLKQSGGKHAALIVAVDPTVNRLSIVIEDFSGFGEPAYGSVSTQLFFDGTDGNDNLLGNDFDNDFFESAGNDVLNGSYGFDQMFYDGPAAAYTLNKNVDSSYTVEHTASGKTDLLVNFDRVNFSDGEVELDTPLLPTKPGGTAYIGGSGNDIVIAGLTNDKINAGDGDNVIRAGEGNNAITAGTGNDDILAGAGNDKINAGAGANVIDAGDGNNSITTLAGNDSITGGQGNDKISAGEGNNTVAAGDGNNKITTGAGDDTISAGQGNDKINAGEGANDIASGNGNDTIASGSGNDSIECAGGNDKVAAGAGNDRIDGGTGADKLNGGLGADTFVFSSLDSGVFDAIKDFTKDDTLEFDVDVFTSLDGAAPGNLTFAAAATAENHFLIYNAAKGALYYDADGSGSGSAVQLATIKGADAKILAFDDFSFVGGGD